MPGRATGMMEEVANVMGAVKTDCRRAVFGRRLLTFRPHKWYLGVATKLRETLAPLLPSKPNAADCWLRDPFVGNWPFPLSCKGCKALKPLGKGAKSAQGWYTSPGRPDCRRGVVLVIRGVTQLARRLNTLDNHSSDEVGAQLDGACHPQFGRDPFPVREETFRTDDCAPVGAWQPRGGRALRLLAGRLSGAASASVVPRG